MNVQDRISALKILLPKGAKVEVRADWNSEPRIFYDHGGQHASVYHKSEAIFHASASYGMSECRASSRESPEECLDYLAEATLFGNDFLRYQYMTTNYMEAFACFAIDEMEMA